MSVTSSLLIFAEVYKAVNLPFQIRLPSLETLHRLACSVEVMSGSKPAAVVVRSTLRLRSVSVYQGWVR